MPVPKIKEHLECEKQIRDFKANNKLRQELDVLQKRLKQEINDRIEFASLPNLVCIDSIPPVEMFDKKQ